MRIQFGFQPRQYISWHPIQENQSDEYCFSNPQHVISLGHRLRKRSAGQSGRKENSDTHKVKRARISKVWQVLYTYAFSRKRHGLKGCKSAKKLTAEADHVKPPKVMKVKKLPSIKRRLLEDDLLSSSDEDVVKTPRANKLKRQTPKRSLYLTTICPLHGMMLRNPFHQAEKTTQARGFWYEPTRSYCQTTRH